MIDFHPHGFTLPRHTIDGVEQDFYETATLQDNLDHSGGITVSWKSETDEEIPFGAYITYNGIRYVIIDQYAPSKESSFHFKYDVLFKHPQNMLDRIPFWVKSKDSSGGDLVLRTSSFTGFPHTIAQKLVNFFAEYANETGDTFFAETIGLELEDDSAEWDAETNPWVTTWGINIPTTNDSAIITVGFDKGTLKSLANSIADAMGCNVFWNWNTKTIEFIAGTTIQGEAYNCFHVLGGTTNMGKVTASGDYAAITQRLALADPVEGQDVFWVIDRYGKQRKYKILKGSIISGAEQGEMMLTKDLIFDEIYPKMELFIKTSRQRLCYLTDENGDFIVDQMRYYYMNGDVKVYAELAYKTDGKNYDSEGHELTEDPTFKMFAKWYVSLAYDRELTHDYVFDQSKLIDDKPLSMLFQVDFEHAENMSKLVGRQFELTYIPEDKKEWDKTDTVTYEQAFEAHKGEFRIAFVAEGEVLLPSVGVWTTDAETHESYWSGLCPNAGDKVTLVNMALTDEVTIAKENLLDAAKEIIGLMNAPAGEYTEQMVFKNPSDRVSIGDPSPFNTPGRIQHGPIVTAITHNLDTDVAEVTAGAWSRKSKTGGTADKLEVVTVSANSSTEGGTPYSDGSIGLGGGYGGNSVETYEQTNPKPESMFVAGLSNTIDAVACDANGKVKMDTDVYTKITALAGIKDVTSACTVAVKALPPVQVVSAGTNITVELYVTDRDEDETLIVDPETKNSYDLSQDKRWLRLHFPQGYDMSLLQDALTQMFYIEHPAFLEREVGIVIQAMREGESGTAGSFKSRAFCRTNIDISNVEPYGGDYNDPIPTDENAPHTNYYTIGGNQVQIWWYDGIPQGDAKLWSTVRTFSPNSSSGSWSHPSQETDTTTTDIEFAFEQDNDQQPQPPVDGESGNRHGCVPATNQIWYDTVLDAHNLPTGKTWSDMVWRAERKTENGVVGEWAITRIKGEHAIRCALDNEHEDFLYSDSGLVAPAGGAKSQARLYDGSDAVTSGVTWSIDPTGTSGVIIDTTSEDYATKGTSISNSGLLTVKHLTTDTAIVKVKAVYKSKPYYAEFTANKVSQDKYDLVFNENSSIAYNPASYSPKTIKVYANRTNIANGISIATIDTATENPTAGMLRLFTTYHNGTIRAARQITATVTESDIVKLKLDVTGTIAYYNDGIYFELRRYTTYDEESETWLYDVVDFETVEIAKAQNGNDGNDGDDGKYTVTQYALSDSRTTHPAESSSDWSTSQPTPTTQYPYVWQRSRVYNPNTSSYEGSWVYVCLTGEAGKKGDDAVSYEIWSNLSAIHMGAEETTTSVTFGTRVMKYVGSNGSAWTSWWGIYGLTKGANGDSYECLGRSGYQSGGFSAITISVKNTFDYVVVYFRTSAQFSDGTLSSEPSYDYRYMIPVVKEGLQGCVVRVSEWKSGSTYRNDEGVSGLSVGYIDVCAVVNTNSTEGYDFYQVKKSDTAGSSRVVTNSTTSPDSDTTNFSQLTSVGPIFTSLLIAKNAYIKFGTGNQFVITDAYNDIQAGMKGDGDIRIWAGGNNVSSASDANIYDAPFRVYKDGKLKATDGEFSGKITASTIEGSDGVTIKSTTSGNYILLKPSDNSIEGFYGSTSRFSLSPYASYGQQSGTVSGARLKLGNSEYGQDSAKITSSGGSYIELVPSAGLIHMMHGSQKYMSMRIDPDTGVVWLNGKFALSPATLPGQDQTYDVGEIYRDKDGFLHVRTEARPRPTT